VEGEGVRKEDYSPARSSGLSSREHALSRAKPWGQAALGSATAGRYAERRLGQRIPTPAGVRRPTCDSAQCGGTVPVGQRRLETGPGLQIESCVQRTRTRVPTSPPHTRARRGGELCPENSDARPDIVSTHSGAARRGAGSGG